MILFDVTKKFDFACKEFVKMDPELLPFAEELVRLGLEHPNRSRALENVCHQVEVYEHRFRGPRLDIRKRNIIIAQCAQLYMKAIKKHRDQANMSDAARALLSRPDPKDEVAHLLKEVPENYGGPKGKRIY